MVTVNQCSCQDEEELTLNYRRVIGTKELENAVECLIRFLADKRQKISKLLQTLQNNHDSFSYRHSNQEDEAEDHLQTLEIVDTALLKSYMMTHERLVGSLLRVNNHCNPDETESLLLKHKVCNVFVVLQALFNRNRCRGN